MQSQKKCQIDTIQDFNIKFVIFFTCNFLIQGANELKKVYNTNYLAHYDKFVVYEVWCFLKKC